MLTGDVELSGLDRDFWHWWPSPDGKLLALCPLASTDTFQIQIGVSADAAGEFSREEIQGLIDQRSGRNDMGADRTQRIYVSGAWCPNPPGVSTCGWSIGTGWAGSSSPVIRPMFTRRQGVWA
jgi:hypothetical protein